MKVFSELSHYKGKKGGYTVRKWHKEQILEVLGTMKEAQKAGLYADCQDGALALIDFIDSVVGEETRTALLLEEYCQLLFQAHNGEINAKLLRQHLYRVENSVKTELKITKYKVLFLPYYDNTWESMKSLYLAFSEDPLFETEIVIIPIQRNTNEGIKYVWDDYLTPAGIPNTHFDVYDFEVDRPDIVFYNQPYDGVNISKFYSSNVRKYTDCMVYVPYSVKPVNAQAMQYQNAYTELEAIQRCDLFIAQSKAFYDHYLKGTPLAKKALIHGHPKLDSLYFAKTKNEYIHYDDWAEAIGERRVILLNTHYSYMIEGVEAHPGVKGLIDNVMNNEELFLIWRPHPQAFLMKMSPQMQAMIQFAEKHKRMLIDRSPSMTSGYMYADCLISLFPSTVVMDALFLDLPVFVLGREDLKRASNYQKENQFYLAVAHEDFNQTIPDQTEQLEIRMAYIENSIIHPLNVFLTEIRNGKDSKELDRARFRCEQFPNPNGTVAKEILKAIKNKLEGGTM